MSGRNFDPFGIDRIAYAAVLLETLKTKPDLHEIDHRAAVLESRRRYLNDVVFYAAVNTAAFAAEETFGREPISGDKRVG